MRITLKSVLERATSFALDLLLPTQCLGCSKEGKLLCLTCIAALPRLEPPYCEVCSNAEVRGVCRSCREQVHNSDRDLEGMRAPYLMQGLTREAIHHFKYRNVRVAAPLLGRLLADYLNDNPMPGEVLVPVPLHPRKLRERGYNQAGLLAREVGKITGLPVDEKLLYRTRNTLSQTHTSGSQQRLENMAGAFACRGDASEKSFIVVDDVSTTGNTLTAGAAALKDAGASSVWGLVLAKEARQGLHQDSEEPAH